MIRWAPTTSGLRRLCTVAATVLLVTDRAVACAVCFGDPESAMAKGAVAGVLVLGGVVLFVLAGVAGTGLWWIRRDAILNAAPPNVEHDGQRGS